MAEATCDVVLDVFVHLSTALVCLLLLLGVIWLPFAVMHEDNSKACMGRYMLFHHPHGDIFTVLHLPFLLFVTVWMASVAKTRHMKCVAGYLVLNFATAVFFFLVGLSSRCKGPFHTPQYLNYKEAKSKESMTWTDPIATALLVTVIWTGFGLYVGRVEAVESTALLSFRISPLRSILAAVLALLFPLLLAMYLRKAGFAWARFLFLGSAGALVVLWLAMTRIYFRALFLIMAAAGAAVQRAPCWMTPTAKRVNGAMRGEILCLCISFASSAFTIALMLVYVLLQPEVLHVPWKAVLFLDSVCNVTFALMLCGVFSGAQGAGRRAVLARRRSGKRSEAVRRWNERRPEKGENVLAWQEKIEELANRAISLTQLLAFYRDLPKRMPHFDPSRHTTSDIVYQVLIPMTSEQKCSASEILMNNVPTRPGKMATHSWTSLFRDLVAGILADAFGDSEYLFFSQLLDHEMPVLERWVDYAGVGGHTYWICAFSVNQHRGICGRRKVVDHVTGRSCPPCSCGLKKAWNTTEPTLPDGRSVPCEMNKFDDLMRLLASTNPSFSQAVIVDSAFTTFNRAWCIAEMATANEMGMNQELKISFAPQLAEHEEELMNLRIRDMQASREEDKEAILASISDQEAFDTAVQRLIWEDLLPSWNSMDALERMAAAGRIIRWLGTEAWMEGTERVAGSTVSV